MVFFQGTKIKVGDDAWCNIMISVLICSIRPNLLAQVKQSISKTIGVEHEVIAWDNRPTRLGICEVYNRLAAEANFPYLLFVHEDVFFRNQDWGASCIQLLSEQPDIGLIGVAGGKYKSRVISGWRTAFNEFDRYRIVHQHNHVDTLLDNRQYWKSDVEDVCCADGVFLLTRKTVWEEFPFAASYLKGFHFYDMAFSLDVASKHRVVVANLIDMVHLTTGGDYGDAWIKQGLIFNANRAEALPTAVEGISLDQPAVERAILSEHLDRLKKEKISFPMKKAYLQVHRKLIRPTMAWNIFKFLYYRPLKLYLIHNLIKRN